MRHVTGPGMAVSRRRRAEAAGAMAGVNVTHVDKAAGSVDKCGRLWRTESGLEGIIHSLWIGGDMCGRVIPRVHSGVGGYPQRWLKPAG